MSSPIPLNTSRPRRKEQRVGCSREPRRFAAAAAAKHERGGPQGPGRSPKAGGLAPPAGPQRGPQGREGGRGRSHRPPPQQRAWAQRNGALRRERSRARAHAQAQAAREQNERLAAQDVGRRGAGGKKAERGSARPKAATAERGQPPAPQRAPQGPGRDHRPQSRATAGAAAAARGKRQRSRGTQAQRSASRRRGRPKRTPPLRPGPAPRRASARAQLGAAPRSGEGDPKGRTRSDHTQRVGASTSVSEVFRLRVCRCRNEGALSHLAKCDRLPRATEREPCEH